MNRFSNPRFLKAFAAYAVLAAGASFTLDGKPRMVVWLFLGLFAIRTILVVLKESVD